MSAAPPSGSAPGIRHEGFLAHAGYRYLKWSLALMIFCLGLYVFAGVSPRHSGGTWLGYGLGSLGAGLILWLSWLGIRKRNYKRGRGSLKAWTSAHVYLGLSLLLIGTLHTGFQFGWNVHTLAYALMVAVILSGLWGIWGYAITPPALSDNRMGRSQREMLDSLAGLDRELEQAAQALEGSALQQVQQALQGTRVRPPWWMSKARLERVCPSACALRALDRQLGGSSGDSRRRLETVVRILERKVALLSRARRHIRHRQRLRAWLAWHVPLTITLIGTLSAHVFSVFYYW